MAEGFVAFMELGKSLLKQDRCKQSCSKLDLAGCTCQRFLEQIAFQESSDGKNGSVHHKKQNFHRICNTSIAIA
jgi:hypothetical protein